MTDEIEDAPWTMAGPLWAGLLDLDDSDAGGVELDAALLAGIEAATAPALEPLPTLPASSRATRATSGSAPSSSSASSSQPPASAPSRKRKSVSASASRAASASSAVSPASPPDPHAERGKGRQGRENSARYREKESQHVETMRRALGLSDKIKRVDVMCAAAKALEARGGVRDPLSLEMAAHSKTNVAVVNTTPLALLSPKGEFLSANDTMLAALNVLSFQDELRGRTLASLFECTPGEAFVNNAIAHALALKPLKQRVPLAPPPTMITAKCPFIMANVGVYPERDGYCPAFALQVEWDAGEDGRSGGGGGAKPACVRVSLVLQGPFRVGEVGEATACG